MTEFIIPGPVCFITEEFNFIGILEDYDFMVLKNAHIIETVNKNTREKNAWLFGNLQTPKPETFNLIYVGIVDFEQQLATLVKCSSLWTTILDNKNFNEKSTSNIVNLRST